MGSPLRDEHAEVFYECAQPAAWGTCPFFIKSPSLRVKKGAGTYDGWRARGLLRGTLVRSDPTRVYSQKTEGTPSFSIFAQLL
ncbi:hypothetical protein ASD24_29245 [Paenibacillus sp. Root52]|nr:hypothetical protein ASD24_29245 [Paenibacillus sp. Root52]